VRELLQPGARRSTALVVLLAVATVGFVWLAMQPPTAPSRPDPVPQGTLIGPTQTGEPTSPDGDASRSPTGALVVQEVEPPLTLASAGLAFRAEPGTCLGGAEIARTTDGGRSWQPVETPTPIVLQLRALSVSELQLVGGRGEACAPGYWSSADRARSWDGPARQAEQWHRLATETRRLNTPTGIVLSPCRDRSAGVRELEALSASDAVVLCQDGAVYRTIDGGSQWARALDVPGSVALAWETRELGWVLSSTSETCAGYQLNRTIDGGTTWQQGGCVGEADLVSPGVLPSLAFSDSQTGMAVVGEATFVTRDGGLTWRPR
jgi:photosystem II stability/assembly factor-like uncharacterized protein